MPSGWPPLFTRPAPVPAQRTSRDACEFVGPCPACNGPALWQTLKLDARASTVLLGCPTCDRT